MRWKIVSNVKYIRYKDIKNNFYKETEEDIKAYEIMKYTFDQFDISEISEDIKDPFTSEYMLNKLKENKMLFLDLEEEAECVSMLKTVNYYTLKYYANSEFGKSSEKEYKSVMKIYFFNKFLCTWLHELISHLEVHLRTVTVDTLINEYNGELPKVLFYLDKSIYKKEKRKQAEINKLLESFNNIIEQNKKHSKSVEHHLNRYSAVPAWAVFDLATIGTLSTFFQYLEKSERKKVTNFLDELTQKYCPDSPNKMHADIIPSWINSIRHLRNVVSHTGKIYGENFDVPPKKHLGDDKFFKELEPYVNYDKRLSNYLVMMKRLYMTMPKTYHTIWNDNMKILENKFNEDELYNLSKIGFLPKQFENLYI